MTPDPPPENKLSRWLDQLQQESWQLELLISGFAIFLLIGGLEPFQALEHQINRLILQDTSYVVLIVLYSPLEMVYYVLLGSLLLHVVLRGLWISTIGLRYVSGDIDFSELSFQDKFSHWLRRRIGSFDRYIERLERICSVLFGYTFLLIFSILGLTSFLVVLLAIQIITRWMTGIPVFRGGPGFRFDDWVMLTYVLLGLLYLIDFVTLGWLKRLRYFSRVYYPVYRFVSFITFANLYRPIYYNLIDNRFGRRLAYFILPLSLLMVIVLSIQVSGYTYLAPDPAENSEVWYLADHYISEGGENVNLEHPSLESRFVNSNYLRIFMPYVPRRHDETVRYHCPDLAVGRFTGIKLRGEISSGQIENYAANVDSLLSCMRELWRIHIDDSLYQDIPVRFYEHPVRNQPGLEAVVPIHDLAATEHVARIDRVRYIEDSLRVFTGRQLYFYKE